MVDEVHKQVFIVEFDAIENLPILVSLADKSKVDLLLHVLFDLAVDFFHGGRRPNKTLGLSISRLNKLEYIKSTKVEPVMQVHDAITRFRAVSIFILYC
jgi:hypothetical protein